MGKQFSWIRALRRDAEHALKEGGIRDLDFSGPTYLVEFYDSSNQISYWPFLQFDERGKLKDAFCSCEKGEKGCIHLASAYLKILGKHHEPLHFRFEGSLWNVLCKLLAEHIGYEERHLKKEKEGVYIASNELYFEIQAKNPSINEKLKKLIENRTRETPENSLKFSNLSQDEITRWREGRPLPSLRYTLSFWYDLAKWLMFLQEDKLHYEISFQENANGLPTQLCLDCNELHLEFNYPENELPKIIPALASVKSPLSVEKRGNQPIVSISYQPDEKSLLIEHSDAKEESYVGKEVGEWIYVSERGFFSKEKDSLLNQPFIPKERIDESLDRYPRQIAKGLKNKKVDPTPRNLEYSIYFDKEWNLHFDAFLFEKGDLQKPGSALFNHWAYLKDDGFYRVDGVLFPEVYWKISSQDVSRFVNQHRVWLNAQEGFQTHLAGVDSNLTYSLGKDNSLKFHTKSISGEEAKDFGDWVYYPQLGFFSKHRTRLGLVVRAGLEVHEKKISSFIRANKEELENITGFFAFRFPILQLGLEIGIKSQSSIFLKPVIELIPDLKDVPYRFFGDFIYVEKEGFSELPLAMRLPEDFQEERVISSEFLPHFFTQDYPSLEKSILKIDPRLKIPHKWDLEVRYLARKREGGLRVDLIYLTEWGEISVSKIHEAILKKKHYLFSEAGLIDVHDERFQWVRHLKKEDEDSFGFEFSTMEFIRLDAAVSLKVPTTLDPQSEITTRLLKEMRELSVHDIPNIKELKSDLRIYQQTGLKWLWFLYRNELSGLLCDEMGLGKTHQAMALMAAIHTCFEKDCNFLVVCPTSVIYHWEDKLATFLPSLKVQTFHGLKRSLKQLRGGNVILTSYGILRMEREKFKKIPFELAVFDEIQIAKNPHSRVHHALLQIDAKMRLGLTGTPIENNLRELKSLFDIALPGYMPGETRFRELFINPIERGEDEEKKALLSQMIRPFILRRKKAEVLQELPEKTINTFYCDLSPEQIKLYTETVELGRSSFLGEIQNQESQIPYIHIFSLLTRLKQICDHPALVAKDPENYKKYHSGKWELFVELLDEARESDQKVVIFSQYLFMLDIMAHYFREQGWSYSQIRGDTIDRREEIRRFQEDPNCKLFIGSLQAAGLGIDLTAASSVILYDRWWNAARENQAIDRVHRIGQKWGVQVYKLISKGTIEEKIDRMIFKKGQLLENIVSSDDQTVLKKLTRAELIDLLTYSKEISSS